MCFRLLGNVVLGLVTVLISFFAPSLVPVSTCALACSSTCALALVPAFALVLVFASVSFGLVFVVALVSIEKIESTIQDDTRRDDLVVYHKPHNKTWTIAYSA